MACVCRMRCCGARPLPKRFWDPRKKALCILPPLFLGAAFIHYDARLVEGGSPHAVPSPCLKLSNETPKHFLTNIIFSLGVKRVFDILICVFIEKKTSGMSDLYFRYNMYLLSVSR